jgi:hypothetical protein
VVLFPKELQQTGLFQWIDTQHILLERGGKPVDDAMHIAAHHRLSFRC